MVDADIGDEAGAGGAGDGGPAGGGLALEFRGRDQDGGVGEVEDRGAEGCVGG